MSALYDVTHGAGLAVIAPLWMRYVCKKNPGKLALFANRIFEAVSYTHLVKNLYVFPEKSTYWRSTSIDLAGGCVGRSIEERT